MAEEAKYGYHETTKPAAEEPCATAVEVESTDRGLFGFGKKKEEEKCEETTIASEFEKKVQVCEPEEKREHHAPVTVPAPVPLPVKEEEKHESLIGKLSRSDSSSSSSSEEEVEGENGEKIKRKKKKGLKEKILGDKKEEEKKCVDTSAPVEKYDDVVTAPEQEEKKGFLDKIKDKLPGGKKTEEVAAPPPPPAPVAVDHGPITPEAEGKEKKGFLDKIKEKLPGYHPKSDEEKEKEKEKEGGAC
uniref:Dehydrin n=1 Tax=Salvia officinalis TaxID=38868 RepID=F5C7J5_SALOF|nr:dehydrin [Salvia officinalis]